MTNACPPDRLAHVAVNTSILFHLNVFCILYSRYILLFLSIDLLDIPYTGIAYSMMIAISCVWIPARW